jgi:signal transduction histidine kinase
VRGGVCTFLEHCTSRRISDILKICHSHRRDTTIRTDQTITSNLQAIGPWLVQRPRRLQAALDLAFLAATLATFGQVWDPDVLFHVIWVVLTLQAFLFGLRVSVVRIVIAGLLLLAYFNLGALDRDGVSDYAALDLAEWPLMIVIAVIVAVMADRLARTTRHYAELYRQASDRLLTAQESERRRLGRDLHDGVGQTLTAMVFTLDAAESVLWAEDRPPSRMARAAVGRAQDLAAIALEETRDVAYQLRPDRLVETGLVAATARMAAQAGADVTVIASDELRRAGLLDPEDEMNVYRIVQEAVSNAARHASARTIQIEFAATGGKLAVSVVDDGVGFDPRASVHAGLGLAGMKERAIVLRSRLSVSSRAGRGTRISLFVPLPRPGAHPMRESTAAVAQQSAP